MVTVKKSVSDCCLAVTDAVAFAMGSRLAPRVSVSVTSSAVSMDLVATRAANLVLPVRNRATGVVTIAEIVLCLAVHLAIGDCATSDAQNCSSVGISAPVFVEKHVRRKNFVMTVETTT
ncbi:unnamed protein product [Peronospora destructor]|uniref:Secreted protein n=1 Tax=Peronospora destructor TaxID=86335 RepID=A0AAV0VDS0_9STRA|nr:unnamed protein product [Peronospora destructor]